MTILMRYRDSSGYTTEHYRVRRSNGDLFAAIQKSRAGRFHPITGDYRQGPVEWQVHLADLSAGYHSADEYVPGEPRLWVRQGRPFTRLAAATEFVLARLAEIEPPVVEDEIQRVPMIVVDENNDPDNAEANDGIDYCSGCGDEIAGYCDNDSSMCDHCCGCC